MSCAASERGLPGSPNENSFNITAEPGSYALRLRLPAPVRLSVGRLGTFLFPAGDYLYLGSARGPGGIRARLRHHFRQAVRPHWHLDWLRPHAILLGGWYTTSPGHLECDWSQAIRALPGIEVPALGFGASDCRRGCPAHLLMLYNAMQNRNIEQCLRPASGQYILTMFPPPDSLQCHPF